MANVRFGTAIHRQHLRRSSRLLRLICRLLLVATCPIILAQSKNNAPDETTESTGFLSSYEGQNVSSIEVAGQPGLAAAQYFELFAQQVGKPFSKYAVDKTADAIKAVGHFQQVETQASTEPDGVGIVYIVQPADYIGIFEFPGAARFPYSQLIQEANYPVQEPFNQAEIKRDVQSLLTFYRQEGFFRAAIEPQVNTESKHAIANVLFHSTLGPRAKFGSIAMEGAPDGDKSTLQHKLTTLSARLRGAAIRPEKTYHHSTVTKANQYLQKTLEKQGYLGAQVKITGAEYEAASNRADIHFDIQPGALTAVQIEGAHLWPWTRNALLPMYQKIGVDDETVQEEQRALISYFQQKGILRCKGRIATKEAGTKRTCYLPNYKGKRT
jgi:outer membrane protein insertion porin family